MNVRKNFLLRVSKKTLYVMTVALVATVALGVFLMSGFNASTTVSAQDETRGAAKVARQDMLSIALDFGTAADYAVFADQGVVESNSRIDGRIGATRNNVAGKQAHTDLARAFSAIEQLPCAEKGAELRRGNYEPGVFCASSGELSGNFILDGRGNAGSIFIFRVDGKLTAERDLNITLINGAAAHNVFFVTRDGAAIGEGVNFAGGVVARNSVTVGNGSTVGGKVLSVDGKVALNEAVAGPGTGVLEICKNVSALRQTPGLADRIFRFQIGTQIILVPFGTCSGPITLPAGMTIITELIDGPVIPTGTFNNRFRLIDVRSPNPERILDVNLPTRTVTVDVRQGTVQTQTVVDFINVFAVMAVVEICKYPAPDVTATGGAIPPGTIANSNIRDRDVTGFFDFTIDVLLDTVITVPVGGCSRPIQVNVPTTPGPVPAPAEVAITELAEDGFTLEDVSTFPADRLNGIAFNVGLNNSNILGLPPFFNPGGGVAFVDVLEGGTANQTTVNFFNRSNPGIVKICKIAGPGIPIGTRFVFDVFGREPSNPFPGTILPGTDTVRRVVVRAGPADQGGFCNFVTANTDGTGPFVRYIVGSQVLVDELGVGTGDPRSVPLDPVPGIPAGSPGGVACTSPTMPVNPCPAVQTNPPTGVRTGRIRLDRGASAFESPATIVHTALAGGTLTLNPNPDLVNSRAIFRARRGFVEVEFTNFLFRPVILKVCKVPGPGVLVGAQYTFTFAQANASAPILAPTIAPVTITVGPSSTNPAVPETTCAFVQGPFTGTATNPVIGTFNFGTVLTITESATTPASTVTAITALSGTLSNIDLPNRRADLTLNATTVAGGIPVNEVQFTNSVDVPGAPIAPRAAFDFDGDGSSDMSAFRPSDGVWHMLRSRDGYAGVQFGTNGDRLAAADYDGDGKADAAVYRAGVWHILRSRDGYTGVSFGTAGDVPQAADFDGDGKADVAVFRPSNGVWYVLASRDGFSAVQFGTSGDKPVAADYDGDGKADVAVYRAGVWHILGSRNGYSGTQFGIATDKPVAADYDGDGKVDIAVYRAGVWHLLRSRDGYAGVSFGMEQDVPVPADYNGDGKTDIAVYREGTWHILDSGQTESGYRAVQFGAATDMPVPFR